MSTTNDESPLDPAGDHVDVGSAQARAQTAWADVRAAEAARVIGMLEVDSLPQRAALWVEGGIPEAHSLAAFTMPEADPDGSQRADLLAQLARSLGLSFASAAEARTVHAETVITSVASAADPTQLITDFSNNFTDDVAARAWARVTALFRRR